jgi:hypothetical protein
MATASYVIELASTAGAFPTTWIDITAYVTEVSITRGRDDTLAQIQPGTASLTVVNNDGRFSPAYTLGAYYPNVALMRAVRISGSPGYLDRLTFAQIAAMTFAELATYRLAGGLYYGYIQQITPQPEAAGIMTASIDLTDGFAWLDLASAAPTYSSGTLTANVPIALAAASWPAGNTNIAAGVLTFTPSFSDSTILSQLQTIVNDNEGGILYMDGSGSVVAQDQNTRFSAPYTTSVATLTDTDHVVALAQERPVRDIANEVKVTYSSGAVTKTDAPSQTAYGPRRLNLTAGFLAGTEADDWASWLLSQRKDPKDRLSITFIANKDSGLILHAMVRDLSDRITYTETAGKTGASGEYHIERIEHKIGSGGMYHSVTWQLSPVVPYSRSSVRVWWTLGTSTLGTGTRLAY